MVQHVEQAGYVAPGISNDDSVDVPPVSELPSERLQELKGTRGAVHENHPPL
jgi:hypothetical protein